MEEASELISPRISFSHDLAAAAAATAPAATTTQPAVPSRRSDTSLMSRRVPDHPEFEFANAAAAGDVAPADRLFAGGVLLPLPPLPPSPKPAAIPCNQEANSCNSNSSAVKPQAAGQPKRPGSWSSAFSRSSSANSATTATGAPRHAGRTFGCPSFSLMRSRSTGSAALARDSVVVPDAGHRSQSYKKFGGAAAAAGSNGGGSRAYYYGGSRKGSGRGVRVSPVINVPFVGSSVVNALSYLLCDCSSKTAKSRGVQS